MSTAAVEPASSPLPAAGSAPSLLLGSLLGAVLVLAGFVAGGYAADAVPPTTPYLELARIAVYLAVVGGCVAVGGFLANTNPAPGVRGGIILVVSVVIATAFLASAFYTDFKDGTVGPILTVATLIAGGAAALGVLLSKRGIGWCKAIDEQGWASTFSHKRSQGLMVRRYAMIGVLALGITGAYSLWKTEPFNGKKAAADTPAKPAADKADADTPAPTETDTAKVSPPFNYKVPFVDGKVVPLVPVANLTFPLLIVLGTVWVAWRAVNVPPFGDFLIATEAEMNKVSWTPKRRLIQDTIVVLVCLALLTVFLFVIDIFWGWLLSTWPIEVLPAKSTEPGGAADPSGGLKW
jgi:preprotein translocase SecE subunit